MKKFLVLTLSALLAGSAFANEPKMDAKRAEMMKAWQEASTPGAEHEMLKGVVGKWKVTTKSWETAEGKADESVGTSTFKPVFGGRFYQQDFKGKMHGMSYEGTGMMGFNKVTKKFESTWHDSMSTASMRLEGTFDPKANLIAESGEYQCPVEKGPKKMRSEFKMIDKDNMTFVMYMPEMFTGKEYKAMEQTYKRIK